MSAATVWEAPLTSPVPSSRPRLRLVPTGAQVEARPRLRLTRRGRLLRSAGVAVLLVALAVALTSRAMAAPATVQRTVTVPAGSTLSQVAARELPDEPLAQAVVDLQRVNDLTTDQVRAGQVLVVPEG